MGMIATEIALCAACSITVVAVILVTIRAFE